VRELTGCDLLLLTNSWHESAWWIEAIAPLATPRRLAAVVRFGCRPALARAGCALAAASIIDAAVRASLLPATTTPTTAA
jgi:hypothetical protein